MDEACFRVSLKHASLWDEIFRKIEAEGVADGHDSGGKRVDRGRGQAFGTSSDSGLSFSF